MTIKKSLQEFKRTHQDNWQVWTISEQVREITYILAGAQNEVHRGSVVHHDGYPGEPQLLCLKTEEKKPCPTAYLCSLNSNADYATVNFEWVHINEFSFRSLDIVDVNLIFCFCFLGKNICDILTTLSHELKIPVWTWADTIMQWTNKTGLLSPTPNMIR